MTDTIQPSLVAAAIGLVCASTAYLFARGGYHMASSAMLVPAIIATLIAVGVL